MSAASTGVVLAGAPSWLGSLGHNGNSGRHATAKAPDTVTTARTAPGVGVGRTARFLRPAPVLVCTLALSLAAWLVPGTSQYLRGFEYRAELTTGAVLILGGWYSVCILVAILGCRAGGSIAPIRVLARQGIDERFESRFYLAMTVIATTGIVVVMYRVGGIDPFLDALRRTDANSLKVGTGGEAGLATLRYATIIASAVGVHRLLERHTGRISCLWNLVLLLVGAAIGSRLSLLMAVVVFLVLNQVRPVVRPRRPDIIALGAFLVLVLLTVLNYVRNARYYRLQGVDDPWSMNLYQALSYLGAPTQVAVGVSGAAYEGAHFAGVHASPVAAITPTFLATDTSTLEPAARYQFVVDIASWLTTNSAFADTLSAYGVDGLLLSLVPLAVFGAFFGHFIRYQNPAAAIAGVALYAFAEYWRVYLFNQGIAVFAVLVVLGTGLLVALVTPPRPQVDSTAGRHGGELQHEMS